MTANRKKQSIANRNEMKESGLNYYNYRSVWAMSMWELSIQFAYFFISHTGWMCVEYKVLIGIGKSNTMLLATDDGVYFWFHNNHSWNIIIVESDSIIFKTLFFRVCVKCKVSSLCSKPIQSECIDYLESTMTGDQR